MAKVALDVGHARRRERIRVIRQELVAAGVRRGLDQVGQPAQQDDPARVVKRLLAIRAGGQVLERPGIRHVPLLKGEAKSLNRDALYFHFPQDHHVSSMGPSAAVRMGDYKLVERFSTNTVELFNLKNDMREQNDISKEMPVLTERLRTMLRTWRRDTNAYMPMEKTVPTKK